MWIAPSPTRLRRTSRRSCCTRLQDFFDTVVLADEVEAVKPHPAAYRAALGETGVPPRGSGV